MTSVGRPEPELRPHIDAIWPPDGHDVRRRRRPRLWDAEDTYLLLPRWTRPGWLLPTAPRAVASAALTGLGAGATARDRFRGRVLAAVGRLGAARLVPGTMTVTAKAGAESLITHLSGLLGEPAAVASVRLGPPRANRKPVLTMMRANGVVLGYAKVGVNELTGSRIAAEADALDMLGAAELGSLVAPTLLARGTWRSAPFMLLSPLQTRSGSGIDPALRDQAARDLVTAFPVHEASLAQAPWWQGVRRRLALACETGAAPQEAAELLTLMETIEARLGSTSIVTGAQHGDWTPWNLQTFPGATNVWDWERFSTDVPIGLDRLHYEFHTATAVAGTLPRVALLGLRERVGDVLRLHELEHANLRTIWPVYLVSVGERFVTDQQERAGSTKGPLAEWLLPVLRETVEDLDERA